MHIVMEDLNNVKQGSFDKLTQFHDIMAETESGVSRGGMSCDTNGNERVLISEDTFTLSHPMIEVLDGATGTSSNSTTADPMSMDDTDEQNSIGENELSSSSYEMPINRNVDDELFYQEIQNINTNRVQAVPTPVNINLMDIMEPLEEYAKSQANIKEKKYPVLPSISRMASKVTSSKSHKSSNSLDNDNINSQNTTLDQPELKREKTINQLDFTREKIEMEADFFADYRVNTSTVKMTPRQHPLPPIRQTSSLSNSNVKR